MAQHHDKLLRNSVVRAAFRQAWLDSNPGVVGGHEEGGFILQDSTGNLTVVRWPKGESKRIRLPTHANCKVGDSEIVATFHTHPNTGNEYLQEPSETDQRAVREDSDLKGPLYEGEFVISQQLVYFIAPDGHVSVVRGTLEIVKEA